LRSGSSFGYSDRLMSGFTNHVRHHHHGHHHIDGARTAGLRARRN
jgi:hypothetical protein